MGYVYMITQIALILLIGYRSAVPENPLLLTAASAGVALMIWAICTMKLKNLKMLPEPHRQSRLISTGPYRYIRHPMYASVLLVTLSLTLDHFTPYRAVFWLILSIDLHLKFLHEERLLTQKHPEYSRYKKTTKRLIPFIY